MAPPAPARVPATPRTTRSKANTSGSSSGVGLGAPSTSASASTSTPSIALHPGTPGNPGNVGARSESRIPMTTGKMGLLGKKPSRLFHLKEREEGVKESPVARRLASFTHNMTSKARGASGASSNTVPASDGAPPTTHMPSHLPIVRPPTTHETVQAFLRLRPSPSSTGAGANAGHSAPYIEIQGDKQVVMQSPADPTRAHTPRATATYSFDRVFAPAAPQADVFTTTTLPMVEQVLHGRGGLLFSYGVSNSGKTYTMQGDIHPGAEQEKRGMIPRAIQVVFDSIEGLDCAVPVKPVKAAGVELGPDAGEQEVLGAGLPRVALPAGQGEAHRVKVDRNYSYAVFVSYVEIYNDKIFDLLDSVPNARPGLKASGSSASQIPRPIKPAGSFFSSDTRSSLFGKSAFSSFASRPSIAASSSANGGSGVITRQALAIRADGDGGRYVGGMREVRVRSVQEALGVFVMGQEDRQVFGTLANRQSSRSHGVFTIKVVRVHNGAPYDPDSATVSRLCMVDLAGSERNDKSQAEGERLREACNINKSLFALGTCLKTLRENQALLASRSSGNKRKPAVVSFKHVRLTELLESFFTGEGKVVMIVNVNPHDTGFQENSQVMEFSALATQVQTTALDRIRQPFMRGLEAMRNKVHHHGSAPATPQHKIKLLVPVIKPTAPKLETASRGDAIPASESLEEVEEELQVVEAEPEGEEERESDFLVDYLMQKLEERTYEVERYKILIGTIEADLREEIVGEMQRQFAEVDARWQRRLQEEIQANEEKADRKIDIMQRALDASREPPASTADEPELDEEEEDSFTSAVDVSVDLRGRCLIEAPASPTPLRQPLGETMAANSRSSSNRVSSLEDVHTGASSLSSHDVLALMDLSSVEASSRMTRSVESCDDDQESNISESTEEAETGETSAVHDQLGSLETDSKQDQAGDHSSVDGDFSIDSEISEEDDSEEDDSEEDDSDSAEESDAEHYAGDQDSSFAASQVSEGSSVPSTPAKRTRRKTSTIPRKSVVTAASTRKTPGAKHATPAPTTPAKDAVVSPRKHLSKILATPPSASPLAESKSQGNVQTMSQAQTPVKASFEQSLRSEKSDVSFEVKKPAAPAKKRKLGKKAVALDEDALKKSGGKLAVRRMVVGSARP